ncbi:MAG: hypothetical protein O9301_02115 [Leptospira sp.]|nr:hypothetical protein [Leptospira sp.]
MILQMDDDSAKDKEKYELIATCEFVEKRGTYTKGPNNRKQYNEMAQSYYDANYERKKIHDPRCPAGQNWKGGRCCEYLFGQCGMCYGR